MRAARRVWHRHGNAEDNYLQFVAHASTFQDNVGTLPVEFPFAGGILAVGGQAVALANTHSATGCGWSSPA
jgi:hypothetical protein